MISDLKRKFLNEEIFRALKKYEEIKYDVWMDIIYRAGIGPNDWTEATELLEKIMGLYKEECLREEIKNIIQHKKERNEKDK